MDRARLPPDEAGLLDAARRGDRRSVEALLRAHYDRVHAVCRRLTGNDADAADAAQEAMIAIVRGLSRFDGRSTFATWVYRIATNASLDELRRRRRRPLAASALAGDGDGNGRAGAAEPADELAAGRIDAVGQRMAIDAALGGLALDFRVPVVLRDVADLDYGEIAALLDVPLGTVKSRIARGRAALVAALTDPDEQSGGTSTARVNVQEDDHGT
jgi:RNA polymerase sigma-70 factor (ECF subfamily)